MQRNRNMMLTAAASLLLSGLTHPNPEPAPYRRPRKPDPVLRTAVVAEAKKKAAEKQARKARRRKS